MPEDPEDEPIEVESLKDEENQEDSGKKTYPRVDQHYKKSKRKYKRKCWYCNSWSHYKENCKFIRCFYYKRMGTLKPIVGREKLIGSTGKPGKGVRKKKERKERKKERRKRAKVERKKQLKIIEN